MEPSSGKRVIGAVNACDDRVTLRADVGTSTGKPVIEVDLLSDQSAFRDHVETSSGKSAIGADP